MNHTISIVIPTYNGDSLLEILLSNMSKTIIPPSIISIIIIENGKKNNAKEISLNYKKELPIKYLYSEKSGLSLARNIGIQEAQSDIIIFFDNDMTFERTTLVEYDKAIQKYGLSFFYGGPVLPNYEEKPPKWINQYLPWSAKGFSLGDKIQTTNTPVFLGGNHAVPKKLFDELGNYDDMCATDTLGMVGEETRLQERLLNSGYKGKFIPLAISYHWVPKDRCSKSWTLQRRYRAGLTDGKKILDTLPKKYCSIFNIPCYILKKYIIAYMNFLIKKISLRSHKEVFSTKFETNYLLGVIHNFIPHKKN